MSQESVEAKSVSQSSDILAIDPSLAKIRSDVECPQYCGALVLAFEIQNGRPADTLQSNICTRRLHDSPECNRTVWRSPDGNLVLSELVFTEDSTATEEELPWYYIQVPNCQVLESCGWPVDEPTKAAELVEAQVGSAPTPEEPLATHS